MSRFAFFSFATAVFAGCPSSGGGPVPMPTIASFTVSPETLPAGGGTVTFSWAQSDATTLGISPSVGDVSAKTSVSFNVTESTTFTLTATNATGSTEASVAVSVATSCAAFTPTHEPLANFAGVPAAAFSRPVSDNRAGLALVYQQEASVGAIRWRVNQWVDESIANGGFQSGSLLGLYPLDGTFYGVYSGENFNGADVFAEYAEQSSGNYSQVQLTWADTLGALVLGGNSSNNTLCAAAATNGTNVVNFFEGAAGANSGLTGGPITLSGGGEVEGSPLAAGYAPDGTAWVAVLEQDYFRFYRRSGTVWNFIAQQELTPGAPPMPGVTVVGSPDGSNLLLLWVAPTAPNYQAYATAIDIANNGFGAVDNIWTGTAAPSFAAVYTPDASRAEYALSNSNNQAWVGSVDGLAINTPVAFHPELVVSPGTLQPFYNACGAPMMAYKAAAVGAAPTFYVDQL